MLIKSIRRYHKIHGSTSPGFEPLQKHFESLFERGLDKHSQLAVYVGEEQVVDVYGTTPHLTQAHYDRNTLQAIFSNGKSVAAILMAIMRDQGLIEYNAPVANYWPEFAQNGKEHVLVQDVLRHDARLHFFDRQVISKDTLTQNIKNNSIGKIIEEQSQIEYPHGAKRSYHGMNRDWITNEIFRRVEPRGRTMGEYFREEV